MNGFLDRAANAGRQKLPVYYRINGAVYMMKAALLTQAENALYGEGTYAYIMPKQRSIDIDDEFDFAIAETIIDKFDFRKK